MSFTWIRGVFANSCLGPADKIVLLAIAQHADPQTGECWPSRATLAEMTGLTERHVTNALKRIEEVGEATITRGLGRGNQTIYRLSYLLLAGIKGESHSPITAIKGEPHDIKGERDDTKKVNVTTVSEGDTLYRNDKGKGKEISPE